MPRWLDAWLAAEPRWSDALAVSVSTAVERAWLRRGREDEGADVEGCLAGLHDAEEQAWVRSRLGAEAVPARRPGRYGGRTRADGPTGGRPAGVPRTGR